MQSTHGSSKGKGRAEEGDYEQSLASLSLSDYADAAPLSDYHSSYTDVPGSSYEQAYTGDDHCTEHGSLALMQSSAEEYSGTPGYSSSYPTASAVSLTEGYEYGNEPSDTSNYDIYPGYDNASVNSSYVSSLYREDPSVVGWSDSQSSGVAASSVPSAHAHRTDINNTINRQRPPNERFQLPCEFHNLTGCDRVFTGDDEQGWVDHTEGHLQKKFPTRLRCWFCTDQRFDARETSGGDVRTNFITRMGHIRDHFVYDGYRREQATKDGYLVQHLLDRNIIDKRTYESIINPTTVSPMRGGYRGRGRGRPSNLRSHHEISVTHGHLGHRPHPQVEEKVVAESSSSGHYRSEHKREHNREHSAHSHTHHGSKRGRQNREGHSKPYFAPSVVSLDEAVPPTSVRKRDCSSPTRLENTSVAGPNNSSSNAASRQPASKHSDEQIIAHIGEESVTNIVANELHKLDIGHMGEASNDSPSRIDSPQSEDHSNIRPSSCSTDTSTHESGSFWLAEDSEEEDKRLGEGHLFIQFKDSAVAKVLKAFQSWRENQPEQGIPCDGEDESNPAPNEGKESGKDLETGKRKRTDTSDINNSVNNSNGSPSNRVGCSKRKRTSDRQLTFACPYTKKDPMSFRGCYKYKLSRIRDVKQHLARCHRMPPYCPRCMGTFDTEDERDEHIREFSCPSQPLIRLDGITESQRSRLAKKSASNASPEAQWFAVFDIVFPGHKPRPQSPYVDSELLQDITLYQDFLRSHGPRILSRVLDEQGVVTWHLPNEERDLAAFQQEVLEQGLGAIFDQWLARRSSSSQDPNATSSSGQNTPPSSSNSGERVGSTSFHNSRAVASESSGSRPGGQPADARRDTEHVQGASSDQLPSTEVLDGSYNLEHGNSDYLSGLTYDGSDDELTRFFMDG